MENNTIDLLKGGEEKRDGIKNNYCKNNNIPLLRIPYWEFNNIEKILENTLASIIKNFND